MRTDVILVTVAAGASDPTAAIHIVLMETWERPVRRFYRTPMKVQFHRLRFVFFIA